MPYFFILTVGHDAHFKKVYVLGRIIMKEKKTAPAILPPYNLTPGSTYYEVSVESISDLFPAPVVKATHVSSSGESLPSSGGKHGNGSTLHSARRFAKQHGHPKSAGAPEKSNAKSVSDSPAGAGEWK